MYLFAGAATAIGPGRSLADGGRVHQVRCVVAGGVQLDVDAGQQEEAEGQHDVAEGAAAAPQQSRDATFLLFFFAFSLLEC